MVATDVRPAIGVVGDFNEQNPTHRFTNAALTHVGVEFVWVPTESIRRDAADQLDRFHGLWISPGSPYRSMDGALSAIRFGRERGIPLVGT
jgi:CTP synthase (UTP-ammonia lyase)